MCDSRLSANTGFKPVPLLLGGRRRLRVRAGALLPVPGGAGRQEVPSTPLCDLQSAPFLVVIIDFNYLPKPQLPARIPFLQAFAVGVPGASGPRALHREPSGFQGIPVRV